MDMQQRGNCNGLYVIASAVWNIYYNYKVQ